MGSPGLDSGGEPGELGGAMLDEMGGVRAGHFSGVGGVVEVFVFGVAAGDAVVFEAGEAAAGIAVEILEQAFHGKFVAEVAVELAVDGVAGVSGVGAPDLLT